MTASTPQSELSQEHVSPYSITEEYLRERLTKPSYGKTGRQSFAGFLACLSSLSFGTAIGWPYSVSKTIRSDNPIAKYNWLIGIMFIGCSLGVTSSAFLIRQLGPKKTLKVIGPFYILNWWLTLIPSTESQLTGRFFLGFLGVTYSNAGELLLTQTIHYGIRKYIAIFLNSNLVLGVLMSRIIGTATTKFTLTVICALIPMVHYILIQIVPESPVFLYATSHVAAAKSLAWYRGKDNIYMDMKNIKKDWDSFRHDSSTYKYMLFAPAVYRSLLVVLILTIIQTTSGYFIFMLYSLQVLTRDRTIFSPILDSTIVGFCFAIHKILWETIHTRYNWKIRKCLICSGIFTGLFLSLFTVYLLLDEYNPDIASLFPWLPLPVVCSYIFFIDVGINYAPKVLVYEYMPVQIFRLASRIIQAIYWLIVFFNVFIFSMLLTNIPTYQIFFVYTIIIFMGTIYTYFSVVEPKGKSLIQIQLEFKANPVGKRGARIHQPDT